jgi:hypothetical protein
MDVDDFVGQYADAYCAWVWHCCNSNERSYSATSTCKQAVQAQVDRLLAYRTAGSAFASFDGEAAQSCVDALTSKSCTDATLVHGCLDRVTQAQHKQGEECTYSAECKSLYCVPGSGGAKGYCGAVSVPGGNCSGEDEGCTSGTYCSAYKKCEYKVKAGEKCGGPNECQSFICHKSQKICANPLRKPICSGS